MQLDRPMTGGGRGKGKRVLSHVEAYKRQFTVGEKHKSLSIFLSLFSGLLRQPIQKVLSRYLKLNQNTINVTSCSK